MSKKHHDLPSPLEDLANRRKKAKTRFTYCDTDSDDGDERRRAGLGGKVSTTVVRYSPLRVRGDYGS